MTQPFYKDNLTKIHKDNFKLIALFFSLAMMYNFTNVEPVNPIDLSFWLDDQIKLVPWTVLIYHSWYPTLYLIMYFLKNDKYDREYIMALFIVKYLCILTFILLPSVVSIREEIVPKTFYEKLIMLTYKMDNPYNGFPSSHVACATVAYHYTNNKGFVGKFFQVQMVLIILATMTTKQHIVADCIGGILYAYVVLNFIIPKLREYDLTLFDPTI